MADRSRNIFDQQAINKRNTILVMAMFVGFLGLLGLGFDTFVLGFGSGGEFGIGFPVATLIALGAGTLGAVWSLESGGATILASSCARPADPGDPANRQILNVVEEMAIASGLPAPRVYIIPDPDPNAFATGKDPAHAVIAVTEGLLGRLNREELQAVVAHEMSHIRNFDIRMMTVVAALIGAVMLLSEFGLRSFRFGSGSRRSSSDRSSGGGGAILFVIWILGMILAPFIAQVLAMAVSRQREYLADASGAELTRNPMALVSALEKIDAASEPTRSIKKGTAQLCIADPLGSEKNEREGVVAELFATHPPTAKRIMLLKGMAFQGAEAP